MPANGIVTIWKGTIETIPDGWLICDGNNGTPDLRDRFIMPAGDVYNCGDRGGSLWHGHPFTMDPHDHFLPGGGYIQIGIDFGVDSSHEVVTGVAVDTWLLPPYKSLVYIMQNL